MHQSSDNSAPSRPGVMLYLDIRGPIALLSDAERGQLLTAILDYVADGTMPSFPGTLAIVWAFILPRLDADANRYAKATAQRQYATYCKDCKRMGQIPASYEAWKEMDRPATADHGRYPSTATTSSTDTDASASTTTTDDNGYRDLRDAYPAHRRGNDHDALAAYQECIRTRDEAQFAQQHLALWVKSGQWSTGQYVPKMANWLRQGLWRVAPPVPPSPYGSGTLGDAELEAIRRTLQESD